MTRYEREARGRGLPLDESVIEEYAGPDFQRGPRRLGTMGQQADTGTTQEGGGSPDSVAWRQRILDADDTEQLIRSVQDAIDVLLPPQSVQSQTHAELSALFQAFLDRTQGLDAKKSKAMKALEPLSMLTAAMQRQKAKADPAKAAKPEPAPKAEPESDSPTEGDTAADFAEESAEHKAKFEKAFVQSLSTFIQQRIFLFQVPEKGGQILPFVLSPSFCMNFLEAVEKHLAPTLLEHRKMRLLSQSLSDEQLTEEGFFAIFEEPDPRENVVRFLWNDRWDDYRHMLTEGRKTAAAAKKGSGEGGLMGLLGKFKKDKKPKKPVTPKAGTQGALEEHSRKLWKLIQDGPGSETYERPEAGDVLYFQSLFDFDPEEIESAKTGSRQMLRQEKSRSGGGREGSSRQYLCDQVGNLPPHCGEVLALWAFFSCPAEFDERMLKAFVTSFGTTQDTRRKAMPLFTRWTPEI